MVRRPSCLIPDLTGVSFTIQCDVSCVFVIHGLYYVEVHFSLSTLLRVLGTNKFWIIWDAFPALLIWSWFLPLLFFFVVHFKNIFHRIYFRERERVGRRYKKRERILTQPTETPTCPIMHFQCVLLPWLICRCWTTHPESLK